MTASCSKKTDNSNQPPKPVDEEPFVSGNLKVMTYNIHHCNPPSKGVEIDLNAVVNLIIQQKPDIIALQEVDDHTSRSGAFNQAQEIARKMGMDYYFGKAINYGGGAYGVAILSRFPLSETKVDFLPSETGSNAEQRVLATAKVTLPDGKAIRFGSTHLDAQSSPVNRELQMTEINRIAANENLPFIIAGDFNAAPGSSVIQMLDDKFKRTCTQCDPTIPAANPTKAIDFIAFAPANGFTVASHRVIAESYPSDHLPVVATLQYK